MTTRVKPSQETIDKINKLVEEGKYKNINEFVSLAIEKQLESDDGDEDEIIIESPTLEKNKEEILDEIYPETQSQKLDFLKIEDVPKTKLDENILNLQYDLYGPGTSGLIWIFHNRFLPVKIALYNLGLLISSKKNNWIDFNDWKTSTANYAESISNKLYKYETPFNVGLPMAKHKIESKFVKKRNKEVLIFTKSEASKKRYADQYVGRSIKKEKLNKEIFSGACYEMGLIQIKKGTSAEDLKVALTQQGKDFVLFENPIIKRYRKDSFEGIENEVAFSKKEIDFILEHIISKYPLEKQVIDNILNLKNKKFKNNDITNTFKDLKIKYNKEIISEEELTEISKRYEAEIEKKFMKDFPKKEFLLSPKTTMDWIISRYLELQPIGVLGKMIELGLISREYEGREANYTIK